MNNTANFFEKLEYLKANYPNVLKINPYTDTKAVDEIKKVLYAGGFAAAGARYITDSVVIRLVNTLQNRRVPKRQVSAFGRAYFKKNSGPRAVG